MESRSERARHLARRVGAHRPPPRHPLGWAAIASVWLHLAVVVLASILPGFAPAEPPVVAAIPAAHPLAIAPSVHPPAGARRSGGPADPRRIEVQRIVPEDQRFAHTSPEDAVDAPPEHPDAISADHTAADRLAVSPVTSERPGLPTPVSHGESDRPSAPSFDRVSGDPDAAMGNRADGPTGIAVRGGGGGGADGTGAGRGSPGEGDGIGEGGGARGGAASVAGRPGGPGSQASSGVPVGDDPERAAGDTPSWWDPHVVRLSSEAGAPGAAAREPSTGEATTSGTAAVLRPGRRAETGGVRLPSGSDAPLASPTAADIGTRRIAAPGTADPVDDLRAALGFGPLDRSKLAPRPEWAGRLYGDGMADSSPQTAFDGAPIAWKPAISTEGTPLGTYVQQAEDLIAVRWRQSDLDPHARAIGVQGDVTVRYLVRPDGRTSDVTVVRSSGNPILDELAKEAIPERLPRFPRALAREPFAHEVTLHYRNPLIGP